MTTKARMDSVIKYQTTIIEKKCIECGKTFIQMRRLKAVCSEDCRLKRRLRFRPPTFKKCEYCGRKFGPVERLVIKFCSYKCKVNFQTTGRKTYRKTITKARSAQSLLTYHVKKGNIAKPAICEECRATNKKIEAAHYNYDDYKAIRWLCISCHRKWDKQNPKNVTYKAEIGQKIPFTGSNKIIKNGEEAAWRLLNKDNNV